MPLLLTFAVLFALVFLLWLVSLALKDASIVDIFWGCGFVVVAWICYLTTNGFASRRILLTTLVTIWGLRLALYLFWRNHGKGEDYRYQAMRKRSKNFALLSLPMVFIFQGVLIWLISWPIQFAQMRADELTAFDFIGAALWAIGLTFEAVGDWQLARFKANPNNKGQVMARGLWRYTRHPNYFGDALLWWGIFCFALPSGWWTIVSPIVMTTLLLKISGVALLEKTLTKTKPEYEAYVRRTNAFLPWFPKYSKSKFFEM
jgi:steroid 5-alpha reductase family enzyme